MSSQPLLVNLALFVLAAAIVWYAGERLTRCVDAIAERYNLGRAFLGFLVLATATQLPEVVTNSTAAIRGDARLLLNSMFGGVSMQTAVLVIADFVALRHALTHLAGAASNLAQASLLILVLACALAACVSGDIGLPGTFGVASLLFALLYVVIVWLLWRLQKSRPWQPTSDIEPVEDHATIGHDGLEDRPLRWLLPRVLAASTAILVAGVALAMTAEAVAGQTGLGSSFIGVTLLATATSLPEVSTTLTAVRLGQHSMAVADIFGSNLIMVALLLPSDLLYREGLLVNQADDSARFALALGILLTAIYLVGLVCRHPRRYAGLGIDSWAAVCVYAAGISILYVLR